MLPTGGSIVDTFEDALIAFHEDESGATATEYVILLILIACFVIAIVQMFGQTVSEKFASANQGVNDMVEY
jgi:Flp pilus assembly pilin Flp